MIKILFLALLLTPPPPKPMAQVQAYAVSQHEKITITNRGGFVWIEMSDSDVFGIGVTEEAAAEDFMADVDIIAQEKSPQDILHGQPIAPLVCPPKSHCI